MLIFAATVIDAYGEEHLVGGGNDEENEKVLFFSYTVLILHYCHLSRWFCKPRTIHYTIVTIEGKNVNTWILFLVILNNTKFLGKIITYFIMCWIELNWSYFIDPITSLKGNILISGYTILFRLYGPFVIDQVPIFDFLAQFWLML